jgi:hypothetical protein
MRVLQCDAGQLISTSGWLSDDVNITYSYARSSFVALINAPSFRDKPQLLTRWVRKKGFSMDQSIIKSLHHMFCLDSRDAHAFLA